MMYLLHCKEHLIALTETWFIAVTALIKDILAAFYMATMV